MTAHLDRIVSGFAELTLETDRLEPMEHFYRDVLGFDLISRGNDRVWLAVGRDTRLGLRAPGAKESGDRSIYFEDPAGNVVEAWDFFEHGRGGVAGVEALR